MRKIGTLASIVIVVVMMAVGGWLLYEANTKHAQTPQSGSTPNDSAAVPIKPADVKKIDAQSFVAKRC